MEIGKTRLALTASMLAMALALAGCGGGGSSGSVQATGPTDTGPTDTGGTDTGMNGGEKTALQTATELESMLDDFNVAQELKDAVKYSGMLNAEAVKGDSAMAAVNAGRVLAADMMVLNAITEADKVITDATAAKTAAASIEDETEKAAVIVLLDQALTNARKVKADAQAILDATGSGTLAEAVAAVRGPDKTDPMDATDASEAVAATVLTALGTIAVGTVGNDTPMDAIRHDAADIDAMTWAEIVGAGNVVTQRLSIGGDLMEVKATAFSGMKTSDTDLFATVPTNVPAAGANAALGIELDVSATHNGIMGKVFCGGADCSHDADGALTGSWYFRPDSETELYVADPDKAGSYMVATMYARYGYWLTYTSGDASSVSTYAAVGKTGSTNTASLNLIRPTSATEDVTASYSGNAVGIAVRNKMSGEFTADVSLTATFGQAIANSKLGGVISNFGGGVADPTWRIVLEDTALQADGSLISGNGVAYGGDEAGQWTAQGYGPAPVDHDGLSNTEPQNQRPEGFFGRFNAHFLDGGKAAGAYAARK